MEYWKSVGLFQGDAQLMLKKNPEDSQKAVLPGNGY